MVELCLFSDTFFFIQANVNRSSTFFVLFLSTYFCKERRRVGEVCLHHHLQASFSMLFSLLNFFLCLVHVLKSFFLGVSVSEYGFPFSVAILQLFSCCCCPLLTFSLSNARFSKLFLTSVPFSAK